MIERKHPPTLRDRLIALRRDALAQLASRDTLDSGLLQIVASVSATLAVLDEADAMPTNDYNRDEC